MKMGFRHTLRDVVPHITVRIALSVVHISLKDDIGLAKHHNTAPALCTGEGFLKLPRRVVAQVIQEQF